MNFTNILTFGYELVEQKLSELSEQAIFTIFVGSVITFSITLTYLCIGENRDNNDISSISSSSRVLALNHKVGILANDLVNMKDVISKQDQKLDEVHYRIVDVNGKVDDVNERVEKIEECLTDSD